MMLNAANRRPAMSSRSAITRTCAPYWSAGSPLISSVKPQWGSTLSVSPNGACSRSNTRYLASNETDCTAPCRRSSSPSTPFGVVIGNRRVGGETEVVREAVFGLERRRDVVVGATELAETAGRIALKFLFSRFPDVAAFREAEHVFGIDVPGLVRAFARGAVRGGGRAKQRQYDQQHRPRQRAER